MKKYAPLLFAAAFVFASAVISPAQNYKLKQTTSVSGQTMTSTVYVKGSRKRTESSGVMGMGADVATIEQCDLKRSVQVNDKKKLYYVDPFGSDEAPTQPVSKPQARPDTPVIKGGVITMTTDIRDTGERKQMFGMTARHIKTSMTTSSSPDACTRTDMSMETDGWYIDLPEFLCPIRPTRDPMMGMREPKGGCQDRYAMKSTGSAKLGFPLQLTQTMRSGGEMTFTTSMETIEFTRSMLDDALFNVPASYTLANSSQDLYGRPDFSAMMQGNDADTPRRPSISQPAVVKGKRPGVIRIGVLAPANRSGTGVSADALQSYLASRLSVGNTEGFAVGSEAEARSAECDYILSTDLTKLKESTGSKIGGIFGKVTNTDTSSARSFDVQVDFTLRSLKSGQSVLQNKESAKSSGDAERAAQSVLATEAAAVLAVAK